MKMQGLEALLRRRDQALQSAKMFIKFRDNTIATLEKGRPPAAVRWGGFSSCASYFSSSFVRGVFPR